MVKRANQGAAKVAKKPKVDPALAVVMDTVKKADHLPEKCRAMLASMLPFSLGIASEDRAESQTKVIDMAEETLQTLKAYIEADISSEEARLNHSNSKMTELVDAVTAAEASLEAQKGVVQSLETELLDAKSAATETSSVLADRKSAHSTANTNLVSLQEEKAALEEAFQLHFQTPMAADAGPNYKELQPFLKTMDLETSLYATLPGSCAKSKEERGSFDTVILEQLEKAITAKTFQLGETIVTETTKVDELAASLQEAESDHSSKLEVQDKASGNLTKAKEEQSAQEALLIKVNEAVTDFRPELDATTESLKEIKDKLADFEGKPLANFTTFKTRTTSPEVAPAGA